MFQKILIANRGEIAVRVIRTARRLGIATVSVYCDADADAVHVEYADEAVNIGPPPASASYLVVDNIIDACRQTGADTVHPGYGFLSERADFAAALEAAGIIFIGPNPRAIAAMGDKIEFEEARRGRRRFDHPRPYRGDRRRSGGVGDRRRHRLPGHAQGVGRRRR